MTGVFLYLTSGMLRMRSFQFTFIGYAGGTVRRIEKIILGNFYPAKYYYNKSISNKMFEFLSITFILSSQYCNE